jgi:hypothetical protein
MSPSGRCRVVRAMAARQDAPGLDMEDMMRRTMILSAVIAAVTMPVAVPAPAFARQETYTGRDGRYHYRCKRSSGKTGLLAGAGAGGLGAAALGAGPIGLAAGVIGGGLLGRHLDKKHDAAQNRRNGC